MDTSNNYGNHLCIAFYTVVLNQQVFINLTNLNSRLRLLLQSYAIWPSVLLTCHVLYH